MFAKKSKSIGSISGRFFLAASIAQIMAASSSEISPVGRDICAVNRETGDEFANRAHAS